MISPTSSLILGVTSCRRQAQPNKPHLGLKPHRVSVLDCHFRLVLHPVVAGLESLSASIEA